MLLAIYRLLRVHQWSKNTLIWVALLTSHEFNKSTAVYVSVLAFLAFCAAASAVYAINDTLDADSDRTHPSKSKRPIASGQLSTTAGLIVALVLASLAVFLALQLAPAFQKLLGMYAGASLLYCVWLKRFAIIDVLLLAGLYVIRIAAGAAVIGVPLSFWLLSFGLFVFLSLAIVKRVIEFEQSAGTTVSRGYQPADLALLRGLGIASVVAAVVVLVFYLNSPEVKVLYQHPIRLALLLPIVLYLLARIWLFALRGQMQADPVVFALKDPASYIALAAMVVVALYAI